MARKRAGRNPNVNWTASPTNFYSTFDPGYWLAAEAASNPASLCVRCHEGCAPAELDSYGCCGWCQADMAKANRGRKVRANGRKARKNSNQLDAYRQAYERMPTGAGLSQPNIFPYGMGGTPARYVSAAKKNRGRLTMLKVPARVDKTPRSAAKSITIFKSKNWKKSGSWPIGDLYHARLALVYALSPSHASKRTKVVQAVARHWPEYDWASWWDKKRKGKAGVQSWASYVGGRSAQRASAASLRAAANRGMPKRYSARGGAHPEPATRALFNYETWELVELATPPAKKEVQRRGMTWEEAKATASRTRRYRGKRSGRARSWGDWR